MFQQLDDAWQGASGGGGPWWLSLAAVLLGIAGRVARNARRSAFRQGERLGELERRADSERTRRQQVESLLIGLGVPLPYWPPDGPLQPRDRRSSGWTPSSAAGPQEDFRSDDLDDDDDLADDPETAVRRVPVPPLPDALGARHRRTAAL
jgi:hypothetical protein